MKVSIVIAVYNEAATVRVLLDRVWAQPLPELSKEIVIVESNSTDGSRDLVKAFCDDHAHDPDRSIRVIHQPGPRGKGNAIREGLASITGDIVIIQDADLEYDVADYPALLKPIADGRAAFVLGSRYMGPNGWRIRKFGATGFRAACINYGARVYHALFNALFASRLTDPTTMYKVFRADCLRGLQFTCDRFDFDFELLGTLIRAGYMPIEVPISYNARGYEQGKKALIVRDSTIGVLAILKTRFRALRFVGEPSAVATNPGR